MHKQHRQEKKIRNGTCKIVFVFRLYIHIMYVYTITTRFYQEQLQKQSEHT